MKYPHPGQQQKRVIKGKPSRDDLSSTYIKEQIADLEPNGYHWDRNAATQRWIVLIVIAGLAAMLIWGLPL